MAVVCVFVCAAVLVGFVAGEVIYEIAPFCIESDESLTRLHDAICLPKHFIVCGYLPLGGSVPTVQLLATRTFPTDCGVSVTQVSHQFLSAFALSLGKAPVTLYPPVCPHVFRIDIGDFCENLSTKSKFA